MRAVIALSGGMDSTGLLIRLIADGYHVSCVSYSYGQKHSLELECAQANIAYLSQRGFEVEHLLVDLSSASGLLHSALTTEGYEIPSGHYEEQQMKQTVVPNRNAIFASILYGYALSTALAKQTDVIIGLGVHSGDHAIYPDCRPEFYDAIAKAFAIGNWESERVSFHLPYLTGNKVTILRDAAKACEQLGLDFDVIFGNTNTSYNPTSDGLASGTSGADVERILAFHAIDRIDPVRYVKPWDEVLADALETERKQQVRT